MKLLITSLLYFFAPCLFAQANLGIGLVRINYNDTTVLHLYTSKTDKQPAKTIEFSPNTITDSQNIRNNEIKRWLKPEGFALEYSFFVFRCKNRTDNWYEVIIDNESGQTLWLKKSTVTKFSSWETFLTGVLGVNVLQDPKQAIRTSPLDTAKEINYKVTDCFRAKSMKGDWIEIYTDDHCDNPESGTIIKSGWIKWRRGEQLLIGYSIAP